MQHWYNAVVTEDPVLLTADVLKQIMPRCKNPEDWAEPLAIHMARAGIESDHDMAMVLAHMGHESMDLTRLEESLYYSTAERLMAVWPSRFKTKGYAESFARNPTDLANLVYGTRLGNREPGDGWKFRGRGPFQLTGRYNYERCAEETGLDIVSNPDLLCDDPVAGATSAVWFWTSFVDGRDMKTTTKQINGGYHGLKDRVNRFKRALAVLEGEA